LESYPDEVKAWCNFHNFKIENPTGKYTNIIIPDDVVYEDIFESYQKFEYFDGFSPNLNKHLHLGHLSNLIIAKAIQNLGITNKTIAILGDTLTGVVDKEDALIKYKDYLSSFNYSLDEIYFASEQKLIHDLLIDGEGDYAQTKVFNLGDEKIVGIKSGGSTTYFYQDVALAQKLNASTLYLTGLEQSNHFNSLKKIYNNVNHKGLGLVMIKGKKMSSSEGNVYFAQDIIDEVKQKFEGDEKLSYNVLSGQILKYSLSTSKNINMDEINNVKTSMGLYLSYTMARMFSAGIEKQEIAKFSDKKLNYLLFKSKHFIEPNYLFNGVIDLCKNINSLYVTNQIKGNENNKIMFQQMTNDLCFGCKKLGLFIINKV
jgi:arginyl-tRNA synthetase